MKTTNIDYLVNAVLDPNTGEDAAVAGFRILHQSAAECGSLSNMLARAEDLLNVIAQRDEQIVSLKAEMKKLRHTLSLTEKSRKAFAAEQAQKKEEEVEKRMLDAVTAMIRGSNLSAQSTVNSVGNNGGAYRKVVRNASPRPRICKARRGADTDRMVLSLLNNEWKCIRTLHQQAQNVGFSGSEGAIRFAAERVANAESAKKGRDVEGRISYKLASMRQII